MNATMRILSWAAVPLGALVGGALGDAIGTRPTILLGVLCTLVAFGWLLASPIRALRSVPEIAVDTATES